MNHKNVLYKQYKYRIVQNGGRENFGEFDEFRAIRQSFTHPILAISLNWE